MQNSAFYAFDEDDEEEDEFEDVDELFSKLTSLEPPEELVQQIMDAVAKLPPLSQLQHDNTDPIMWHNQDPPS